jgi:hypothetical protein
MSVVTTNMPLEEIPAVSLSLWWEMRSRFPHNIAQHVKQPFIALWSLRTPPQPHFRLVSFHRLRESGTQGLPCYTGWGVLLCVESDPVFPAQGPLALLTWLLTCTVEWTAPRQYMECTCWMLRLWTCVWAKVTLRLWNKVRKAYSVYITGAFGRRNYKCSNKTAMKSSV